MLKNFLENLFKALISLPSPQWLVLEFKVAEHRMLCDLIMVVIKVTSLLFRAAICIAQFIHAKAVHDANFDDCDPSEGTRRNCSGRNLTACVTNVEPVQEFIYKCGDEVDHEFWLAPNIFQVDPEPKKHESFVQKYPLSFNFTLRKRMLDCKETFHIRTSMSDNVYESGLNVTALLFSPDGYLVYFFYNSVFQDKQEIYYHKEQCCVQNIADDALTVRLCKSTCFHLPEEKGKEMCLPKCCPFGFILDSETGQCQEVMEDWVPSVYVNRLASKPLPHWTGVMKYVPPIDFNCYNDSKETESFPIHHVRLIANGKLVRRTHINRGSKLRWTDHTSAGGQPFCIDAYWNTSKLPNFQLSEARLVVARCVLTEASEQEQRNKVSRYEALIWQSHINVPLIFLPCTLIYLFIVIVYIVLWEKQSCHEWTVMAFSSSQFVLYLVLKTVVGLAIYSDVLRSDSIQYVCNTLAIIHNFAYISTYSWASVLTFDVWYRLSSMKNASQISKGKKCFFFYSCFGVGVPTLIVSVGSVMEWGFWEFPEDMVVMPGYSAFCVVYGAKAFLIYQGLPSVFLFAGNLAFLVLTFCSLWNFLKKEDSVKSKQSSTGDKPALIAKMLVLMGTFLIFEFILNFFGLIGLSAWFTILQGFRILHAVGLFYILVCSKKVKMQLQEKYPLLLTESNVSGKTDLTHVGTDTESMFNAMARGPTNTSSTTSTSGNRR